MSAPATAAGAVTPAEPQALQLAPLRPAQVRYIKLGQKGCWEARSLAEDRVYWGVPSDPVHEAAQGDWNAADARYREQIKDKAAATSALRELKEFFTLDAGTLWITFAQDRMWWAFSAPAEAAPGPLADGAPTAFRRTLAPWQSCDITGRPLQQADLSTKLTRLAGYRRSLCTVEHADYALRRINGETEPGVVLVEQQRAGLIAAVAGLIQSLHWRDFEVLAELIFTSSGWRRISPLGGTMKDLDMLLEQPLTGERIGVQVKSSIDQSTANRCFAAFAQSLAADRFFLVHHTGKASLTAAEQGRPFTLWGCEELAARAVDAGLTGWIAARAG